MIYIDCISTAVHRAFDMDTPLDLLPLTITNGAAMLAGLDSDRMGVAGWD